MADEPTDSAASDFTRAVRAGTAPRPLARTVSPPIQRASTVLLKNAASFYDPREVSYGRAGLQPHGQLRPSTRSRVRPERGSSPRAWPP